MAPNLYLVTRALFNASEWFSGRPGFGRRTIEHWNNPEPGLYVYEAGKGWQLLARDSDRGEELPCPKPVVLSLILRRYLFKEDYESRKKEGVIHEDDLPKMKRLNSATTMNSESSLFKRKNSETDSQNANIKKYERAIFFRLDDEKSWVCAWDADGVAISGPYDQWVFDHRSQKFRQMENPSNPRTETRNTSKFLERVPKAQNGTDVKECILPANNLRNYRGQTSKLVATAPSTPAETARMLPSSAAKACPEVDIATASSCSYCGRPGHEQQ
ncbi:hypothetical protein P152DRAFT_241825 [Eremomyces bilateralis CBS 781.70]|uniref:Uncharacterized protein n=1 Tax=Eremomyces bilateralis CBS 781.70 TaxID=1392243 RepID=A0A6G1GA95_9PEZI|nr:uncharacterized protein P152DRAFT_241825 [Eremomyces bilateralis CBS 781.70]KAF1814998.1 hypothetical protein P152DRAFT_241825 [Eremomyces bilateralis CBS 781.70]